MLIRMIKMKTYNLFYNRMKNKFKNKNYLTVQNNSNKK